MSNGWSSSFTKKKQYIEGKDGRKEGGDVLAAKDELLSEMIPRCGFHTGKPVQDPHFGRVILYHTYLPPPLVYFTGL